MHNIHKLLIPVKAKKIRIGPHCDGGYVLGEEYLSNDVLSLGIGSNVNFEIAYSNLFPSSCITMFDGTIDDVPSAYHKILANKNIFFKNVYTEQDLFPIPNDCLVMMDIEAHEFRLIESFTDDTLAKIKQLCVEIHFTKKLPFPSAKNFLEKLNHYFHLIHIHENNFRKKLYYDVPSIIECTYVNKAHWKGKASREKSSFPVIGLDFNNNPNGLNNSKLDWWIKKR